MYYTPYCTYMGVYINVGITFSSTCHLQPLNHPAQTLTFHGIPLTYTGRNYGLSQCESAYIQRNVQLQSHFNLISYVVPPGHACTHLYMHACTHLYMHACTHLYMHACMYEHYVQYIFYVLHTFCRAIWSYVYT